MAKARTILDARVEIRCSEGERKAFDRAVAKSDDRTISEWARKRLLEAARRAART